MKYTKRLITIEAKQWTGDNTDEVVAFGKGKVVLYGEAVFCDTLVGSMRVSKNDFVIKGIQGEFYPCKPDIFEATYMKPDEIGTISDGYHTFNELYDFRKMYNVALFNEWAKQQVQVDVDGANYPVYQAKYDVHKSLRHNDGEACFGGEWFIVVAVLPTGQISNHYHMDDWNLFQIPVTEKAKYVFDGHTGADVLERLKSIL